MAENPAEASTSLAHARATRSDVVARIAQVSDSVRKTVRTGVSTFVALVAAGVSRATVTRWRRMSEQGDPALVAFFESLEGDMAQAEADLVKMLREPPIDLQGRADYGRMKGAQFLLERSRRDRWGVGTKAGEREAADSMRSILDGLEKRMSAPAFTELMDALAEVGADTDDDE